MLNKHWLSHPLVIVATPIPTPSPQQATLNFGINGENNPLPNLQLWRDAAVDFAVQDAEVDSVQLDVQYRTLEEHIARNDCFYMENVIRSGAVDGLLNIAPLLAADSAFLPEDMVTGVMEHVRLGDGIWGFPLTMQPVVVYANRRQFEQANIRLPDKHWTVSDFEDIMRHFDSADGGPVYRSELFGGVYLTMLMTAYGGRLVDDSTEPYMFYLDDPTNIEAARQVLDLARSGRLQYNELVSQFGGWFGGGDAPLYDGYFSVAALRGVPPRLLPYPRGTIYRPAMYGLHVLYINSKSARPEACYRWFQFIRQHVELMLGMPTHRSLLENSSAFNRGSEDLLAFYQAYDAQLQNPNKIILTNPVLRADASYSVAIQNAIATRWMHLTFDNYILRNGDFEADLRWAQANIELFYACAANIEERPMEGMNDEEMVRYSEEFASCARAVDSDWHW